MSVTIRRLTEAGLQPVEYTAESLSEAATREPDDGVYTVAHTRERYQVIKLSAHLDRLYDSAAREGIALTLPQARLREALRELIDLADYGDVKFRITVPHDAPNEPILSVEPFTPYSSELYERGAKVITVPDSARHNAAAKDTGWMHSRRAIEARLPAGVHTAILLDARGHLLEGTSSNFYAIVDGRLYTAVEGVLGGTAQQIVLEVAPRILPVERQPIHVDQLPQVQEAFITSSSRGVMPVTQIDATVPGDGTPGTITQKLASAYLTWVNAQIESL